MSKLFANLFLAAAAGLAGCTALVAADGSKMRLRSGEFSEYAERVFRLQNEVLDALAFALDEQPDSLTLASAEDGVLGACAGLNAIALRRQRGEATRPLRDARTARGIPECEAAALAAAQLLKS